VSDRWEYWHFCEIDARFWWLKVAQAVVSGDVRNAVYRSIPTAEESQDYIPVNFLKTLMAFPYSVASSQFSAAGKVLDEKLHG